MQINGRFCQKLSEFIGFYPKLSAETLIYARIVRFFTNLFLILQAKTIILLKNFGSSNFL